MDNDVEILQKIFEDNKYSYKGLEVNEILEKTKWTEEYFFNVYEMLKEKEQEKQWQNEQHALI